MSLKNSKARIKLIKHLLKGKGYNKMTLSKLKDVIYSINPVLISNHDGLQTRKQILEFLFFWEWAKHSIN
jgi:hypothetical protein